MQQILWHIPIFKDRFEDHQGIPIYGFGVMLFLAFLICTSMAIRYGRREGISSAHIQDLVIWLFVGGLLGARIFFLLQEEKPESIGDFLWKLPRIWEGGIIFYGSLIGGLIGYLAAYYFVFRRFHLSTLKFADVCAPCVAVGLCLGRLGCFLNGCCFGQIACADCAVYPVTYPLSAPARESTVQVGAHTVAGFTFQRDVSGHAGAEHARVGSVDRTSPAYAAGLRPGDVIKGVRSRDDEEVKEVNEQQLSNYLADVGRWRGQNELWLTIDRNGYREEIAYRPRSAGLHPTQLYEVISMFLLFLVLAAYYPLRRHDGQVMAVFMMGYAVHRYLDELLRDDPRPIGFERYTSVVLFAAGLIFWLWLLRQPPRQISAPPSEHKETTGSPTPLAATSAS